MNRNNGGGNNTGTGGGNAFNTTPAMTDQNISVKLQNLGGMDHGAWCFDERSKTEIGKNDTIP